MRHVGRQREKKRVAESSSKRAQRELREFLRVLESSREFQFFRRNSRDRAAERVRESSRENSAREGL
eukprot:1343246-Amorphochlora_amoeboformis.AAC.1